MNNFIPASKLMQNVMDNADNEELALDEPKNVISRANLGPKETVILEKVLDVLRSVYDPEIPVNIYELGLIYDVAVNHIGEVYVRMTLTSPACPVAGTLPVEIETKIAAIPEVSDCEVEVVWDPTYSMEMMSDAARLQLGLM